MKDYKQIIYALNNDQAKEILSIAVKSIEQNMAIISPIEIHENISNELMDNLAKPVLLALSEGEDSLAVLLQKQLIEHENFLEKQRVDGDNRSAALSIIPLLAVTIPFIEAKFEINIDGNDKKMHFVARIKSLQEVIPFFKNNKSDDFDDFDLSISHSNEINESLHKEILELAKKGKTAEVIEMLLEQFENNDENLYKELILISANFNRLSQQKRRNTITDDYFHVELAKIDLRLTDFLN